MDLARQLEMQRKETSSALRILLGYADKLAVKDLEENREGLEQLKRFSMNMAQFFCVEGHERAVMTGLWRNTFSHMRECWQVIRMHYPE